MVGAAAQRFVSLQPTLHLWPTRAAAGWLMCWLPQGGITWFDGSSAGWAAARMRPGPVARPVAKTLFVTLTLWIRHWRLRWTAWADRGPVKVISHDVPGWF
jgi:hypothetical protein